MQRVRSASSLLRVGASHGGEKGRGVAFVFSYAGVSRIRFEGSDLSPTPPFGAEHPQHGAGSAGMRTPIF
jgi:hypothetical protein